MKQGVLWSKNEGYAPTVLELCAGGGGQALGLENAGFALEAAYETDKWACETLRSNRPGWNVIGGDGDEGSGDIRKLDGSQYRGVDVVAGGVPCPPFSIAGLQLGTKDERDLFPAALRVVSRAQPKVVLFENVRGFAARRFDDYRAEIVQALSRMGYPTVHWRVLNASELGVPQLRPRFILVALREDIRSKFEWPSPIADTPTVGEVLYREMSSRGWPGVDQWKVKASQIAPTLVGGSKKHGGPDLGPTRAKRQWSDLGVDGHGLADSPPGPELSPDARPRITVSMAAKLQGFPESWEFSGRKTAAYRQVGNAFPPPVAEAVGRQILAVLNQDHDLSSASARSSTPEPADGHREISLVPR